MRNSKLKVLIIDDDEDDFLITSDYLNEIEHVTIEVEHAPTYKTGVQFVNQWRHDLYIVDYMLGPRNGLELLAEVDAVQARLPIIMLTGTDDEKIDHAALDAGASDYLVKSQLNAKQFSRSLRYAIAHKKTQESLHKLANFDQLTNLANRRMFFETLDNAISRAERHDRKLAVLFLDLDKFKQVNDKYGHDIGDQLLQAVTTRLKSTIRKEDLIARLSGDEFAILLEDISDESFAARVGDKIVTAISKEYIVDNAKSHISISISISIGIASFPSAGTDSTTLLKSADIAMYEVKRRGRNNYQFFNKSLQRRYDTNMFIETELRHSLQYNQLSVYYQPLFSGGEYLLHGFEALVRWQHADRGFISPESFIPIAEESGQIQQLGEFVLSSVCMQASHWQQMGHQLDSVCFSVNVSVVQLNDENFISSIRRILKGYENSSFQLQLEITESTFMHDMERKIKLLDILHNEFNCLIAIDDFGTGYSSLSYLKRLPIDILKIDRSFVNDIGVDKNDEAIIKATIALAHELEMKVVAEGVETKQQVDFLLQQKCDVLQGFYLSRPRAVEDVAPNFLENYGA